MYYRPSLLATIEESFDTHVWMIDKLLEHARNDPPSFVSYIVATCYERMLIWMKYHSSQAAEEGSRYSILQPATPALFG
jgi:hypothetical protein